MKRMPVRARDQGNGVRLGFRTLANGHAAALQAHGPVRARVADAKDIRIPWALPNFPVALAVLA
jgi:hypothetical protein